MGIKRWKQDVVFSNYIRERDDWTCQRCSKGFEATSPSSRRGLHCSHFHGRGKWSTRFDTDNCTSLCYGCHRYLGSHPIEHTEFILKRLGKEKFNTLKERANTLKKKRDFINPFFLNELNLMLEEISG